MKACHSSPAGFSRSGVRRRTPFSPSSRRFRDFGGPADEDDYCVDLAMLTWHNFREPEQPLGVAPGPVGRKQRRFIVWHSVPKGLETPEQVRAWLVEVLAETERLVREYLPMKSKAYPTERLGDEVVALRDHLAHSKSPLIGMAERVAADQGGRRPHRLS